MASCAPCRPCSVASKDEPDIERSIISRMVAVRDRLSLTNIYLVETPGIRVHTAPARPEAEPDINLLIAEFGANEPTRSLNANDQIPLKTRGNCGANMCDREWTASSKVSTEWVITSISWSPLCYVAMGGSHCRRERLPGQRRANARSSAPKIRVDCGLRRRE